MEKRRECKQKKGRVKVLKMNSGEGETVRYVDRRRWRGGDDEKRRRGKVKRRRGGEEQRRRVE